ncbi:MAG: hypothetical protein XD90_1809 [Methanobacterium sp. 42_16]|jgi:hypothetical protein|nr:MAG: hypothetical protein XD90_1809 [Methanobacterium sp. 42_16]
MIISPVIENIYSIIENIQVYIIFNLTKLTGD